MTTDDRTKLRRLTKSEREWLAQDRKLHDFHSLTSWACSLLALADCTKKTREQEWGCPIPPSLLRRYARNLRPRRDPWAEQARKKQYTKRPAVTRDDAEAGRLIAQAAQHDLES